MIISLMDKLILKMKHIVQSRQSQKRKDQAVLFFVFIFSIVFVSYQNCGQPLATCNSSTNSTASSSGTSSTSLTQNCSTQTEKNTSASTSSSTNQNQNRNPASSSSGNIGSGSNIIRRQLIQSNLTQVVQKLIYFQ